MQAIYCPSCGKQNAFDAKFCSSCALSIVGGQPITSRPSARMWQEVYEQYRGIIIFGAIIGLAFVLAILSNVAGRRPRGSAREGSRPPRPVAPAPPAPPAPPAIIPPGPPAPPTLLESAALGVSKDEWEQDHGASERVDPGGFHHYENGEYVVRFTNAKASSVEKTWGDRNAVSLEQAKEEAEELLPDDARFERSFKSKEGHKVDIYSSDVLKQQFLNEKSTGGKPGNFIVVYKGKSDSVTSILLAYGIHP